MVQFSGNGMIPRERFSPRTQFFMGAASEEGVKTLMAHREVKQDLEHFDQNRNRHGVQYNRLERVTKVARVNHLEQCDGSNWNELTRSAQRDLETPSAELIGGEISRGGV